jgi:hypothetical protein
MRWHTARFEAPAEAAERSKMIEKIDSWWDSLRSAAPAILKSFAARGAYPGIDLPEWMLENLGAIDQRLMWEFGPGLNGKSHRLVITPESSRHLRPLCDQLLKRAPDCDFEFYGARLAESLDDGIQIARSRTGSEILVTGIECLRGTGNRVDLSVTAATSATEQDLDCAWSQAIMICTTLLGEEITDRWLGYADIVPSQTPGPPLGTLKTQFESVVATCLRARQPRPYREIVGESEWSLVRIKPDPDREITRRSDLFVYSTMDLEFMETILRRIPFYSDRFSSDGERFCYLMLDGKDATMERFEDKAQIEEALETALAPQQLGAVMGSGTGTRYSYIDLAVTDVEKASDTVIEVMRQGAIVKNAWILFHDDEWHDEWIGIYDDTPPPLNCT